MIASFVLERIGVACERARLPQLEGEPIALATREETIGAVSKEAHDYGIRKGQAATFARTLCPGLIVVPYDRDAYLSAAEAVWDAIAVETSFVEPVSPEIVFAEISGTDLEARLASLAERIAQAVGCDVRVGAGRSKLIAELASRAKSESAVVIVDPGGETVLLRSAPLSALHLLPEKARLRAQKLGIRTLGDVGALPPAEVERQFKEAAPVLQRLAKGDDGDAVRALWPPPSRSHAVRFDDEVSDSRFIEQALQLCAGRIADALVRDRRFCRILTLTAEMGDGMCLHQREELVQPLREPAALHRAALRLAQRMALSAPVSRLELTASELTAGSSVQLTLMNADDTLTPEERQSLDASLAHVKEKFGVRAIVSASLMHKAQRIHLWTYRLGLAGREDVDVVVDQDGLPVRIYRTSLRRDIALEYMVTAIQNFWQESDWSWGQMSEKRCFRVLTRPDGLFELHETGGKWSLQAAMD